MNEVIIKVDNLVKTFKLYNHPKDRLKEVFSLKRKKYHHIFTALDHVSFEIKRGESLGILGRNGAGKSTLLKVLTGVLNQTSGEVQIKGRVAALLELGGGFNPEISGLENIYFQGAILGFSKEEMATKIPEIIEFADIGEFIHQPVKSYSSGMFARLAFSIAIYVEPEVLIVDEALSVGDMRFQAKCITKLQKMKEKGTTLLFVSHDIGSVQNLCSKAIYMENGKVKLFGNGADVAAEYIRVSRAEVNQDILKEEGKGSFVSKVDSSEQKRVGTGEVIITNVELVDEEGRITEDVQFNELVHLKVHILSKIQNSFSCNYYIQDDKKNLILGASFKLLDASLIESSEGGKYLVTYSTKLPLMEGVYSIQVQVSKPVVENKTAKFFDVVDDAIVFRVNQRPQTKIWSKVYIPSTLRIEKI